MAFIVEKMTLEDESFVYSKENNLIIKKFGSTRKNESEITTNYWVTDRERNFYFLSINNKEAMYNEHNYLFIFNGNLVVIHLPSNYNSTIKILYISEDLKLQLKEIQSLIIEAFDIGGYFCSGINDDVCIVLSKFESLEENNNAL